MVRSFSLSVPLVHLLVALAPAQEGASSAPPTEPPPMVEVPGSMEFTGVMIARPVQPEDAARHGLSQAEVAARRARAQAALEAWPIVDRIPETDETLFRVETGSEPEVARHLMAGGDFQYVEPDWRVYPIACPNDALFAQQWHHAANRMNSCAGWELETGDPSVVVAICDTGVNAAHSDLLMHRQEGYNAVDQQWEDDGGSIDDINGHGTLTTGCAAANGDNLNGVAGTGWNLGHRMMRVSNSAAGGSTISILTHAARTAADQGDRVASVSYTGVKSGGVQTTGSYLRSKGALLVWAADNSNTNHNGSRDDSVVVVGATDQNDAKASFSSFGSFVDLFAPGVSILSTSNSGAYSVASGTSFSTPLTAGLIGLIFSMDPALTPQEAEDLLRAGCDDLGQAGVDDTFGYGRIDVEGTLALVACSVTSYCDALANSTAGAASMDWSGSTSVSANDLVLRADQCPPSQFGVFYFGDQADDALSGDGRRCVGGSLFRLKPVVQIDSLGGASHALDLTDLPSGASILAGETWYFSFWFRDTGPAGWNFADGLKARFCD